MKVVVVDDDKSVRLILQRILVNKFSCEVILADNGREGIEQVRAVKPGLVILDVRMPGLGGEEVLAELRSQPEFASLPVVIASSANDKETVVSLLRKGVIDYLVKPLDFAETHRRLSGVLARIHPVGDVQETAS